MPRLTILTLAMTAAVAASAAPDKPAKKPSAPKKPDPIELLTIEVGGNTQTPKAGTQPAAPPAPKPAPPAAAPKPAPSPKLAPEAKPQPKPAAPVAPSKEAKEASKPVKPAAESKPQPAAPNREVAAPVAPRKEVKKAAKPVKPAVDELPTIEVGRSREPVASPPKPAASATAPVQPKVTMPAPPATVSGQPKAAIKPKPAEAVVSTMTAPLKPGKKPSEAKKPRAAPPPTEVKVPRATPAVTQRPPQPPPLPKYEPPTGPAISAPIDLAAMVREGRATVSSSKILSGKLDSLSDPNRSTQVACLATSTGPAFWQVTLDRPRPLEAIDLGFGEGGPFQWTLSGAQTSADLQSRQGTYRMIVPARSAESDDQVVFPMATDALPPLRVYRLEVKPLAGVGEVRLSSLALWTLQGLTRVEVDAMIPRVGVGSRLPLRAVGNFDLGARQNLTPDVTWEVSPPDTGKVDSLVRLEGKAPGRATVTALYKDTRSMPFAVDVIADAKPDWSVTYIERGPRVPVDGPQPKVGSKVVWFAHVKNYGAADAPQVAAQWRVDGKTLVATTVAKLDRFQQTDVMLPLVWDGKRHHVELVVDPAKQIAEESEVNNSLSVATDSLGVGMWVEESVVRYFHQKQRDLGIGSNGWEDWAQRQVASWNKFQSNAAGFFQSAPEAGVRWRIDRLHIVGDGLLPMAGGSPDYDPDRREQSVHLMLGFPAGDPARSPYRLTSKASPDNPFFMQQNLLKSLTRAIYPRPIIAQPVASGG